MNLRILPYPPGKDHAVTFIDDTDLSTRENTEPLYTLLKDHGLGATKTVWTSPQKRNSIHRRCQEEPSPPGDRRAGATLADPDYLDFIRSLAGQGFEIASHGIAAGNSYRDETLAGFETYRQLMGGYPKINVFHERNIENLYAGKDKLDIPPLRWLEAALDRSEYQGHLAGSPYFWGDFCSEHILYTRLPFHNVPEINTLKLNPSMPFHDPRRPFVRYWFSSSDGAFLGRMLALLSADNVARLRRELGASIVYTHFAKGFCHEVHGRQMVRDEARRCFAELAAHPGLWSPTVSELLDRLRECRQIHCQSVGNVLELRNEGSEPVRDLSLLLDQGIAAVACEGTPMRQDEDHRLILDSIAPGKTVFLETNSSVRTPRPLPRTGWRLRGERMQVEWSNYFGAFRNDFLRKFQ